MLKWVQGSVSAITGSAEPIYGPEAFKSVAQQVAGKNAYGVLERADLEWRKPWSSNVETQTFYFSAASGHYGFVQVIHSNPVGVHYTAQFTCLVRHDDKPEESVWASTNLEEFEVVDGTDFKAAGLDINLNKDGTEYKIKCVVNDESLVDLTFVRGSALGFKVGQDGLSLYGEDLANPWGSMRHLFWPRAHATGKLVVKGKEIVLEAGNNNCMFVMALQGMKPHHAAARWNFLNFQGPTSSVVLMEFTTPPSYGSQTVTLAAVTKDDQLTTVSVDAKVQHLDAQEDDVGWPAPGSIEFDVEGPAISAGPFVQDEAGEKPKATVKATVSGKLTHLVDRVDVMAEIPSFLKSVASRVSGARPYIYQYSNQLDLVLEVDGVETREQGHAFSEATFIS